MPGGLVRIGTDMNEKINGHHGVTPRWDVDPVAAGRLRHGIIARRQIQAVYELPYLVDSDRLGNTVVNRSLNAC